MKTKLLTFLIVISSAFAFGQVGINTTTPNSNAALDVYATDKGFLPPRLTTAQRDAIANPSIGLMIYNSDVNCMQYWNSSQWIGTCSSGGTGTISNCTAGALSGTYTQGTAMTSGNTVVLAVNVTQIGPWTASSTTVNGVTFSGSGTFTTTGAQNITLTASGTPTASGSFTYPFTLGASTCSRSITFNASVGTGTITDCTSGTLSGTYTQGTAMTSGNTVVLTVNATQVGTWGASSTTVNGVTFTGSGTFATTGTQNITLTATGTPTASGSFSFPFTLGTSTCSRSITFSPTLTVVMPGNTQPWARHNLGANTSLDPDTPVQAIHGNYYQWGRAAVVADASTPSGAIAGWNTTNVADGSWLDASKTANDPCPSGFRVPTSQQFTNLINNTTQSNVGTFTISATNFGSAKVFTGGGNKLTFPAAGNRTATDGALLFRGNGYYWSSTQNTAPNAYYLYFGSSSVNVSNTNRTNGFSIRCISQ